MDYPKRLLRQVRGEKSTRQTQTSICEWSSSQCCEKKKKKGRFFRVNHEAVQKASLFCTRFFLSNIHDADLPSGDGARL